VVVGENEARRLGTPIDPLEELADVVELEKVSNILFSWRFTQLELGRVESSDVGSLGVELFHRRGERGGKKRSVGFERLRQGEGPYEVKNEMLGHTTCILELQLV